ncbi:hypothetical protein GCM10008995_13530 [Halobellus salinus]|uniref:Uncharacterized protein n=1 Tax=Halobellus salinus TaxID=931585 RepID=A0A830EPP5_9EURY|nr:hypothetical protein GCM10008995_13530 [Halobellus salinus]SMP09707.1 hypothetical protein SAMN06265347_103135 [Halobellus salinus]
MFVVINGVGLIIAGKSVASAEAAQLPATAAMTGASLVALGDSAGGSPAGSSRAASGANLQSPCRL